MEPISEAIISRCGLLIRLGLGYLKINRESTSLAGGEAQRIRLANQTGTGLRGVLYVLDEPSVGGYTTAIIENCLKYSNCYAIMVIQCWSLNRMKKPCWQLTGL